MPKKKDDSKLTASEQILLQQARDILDIIKSPGWQVIATFIQNSVVFPDPKDFASREALMLPYAEAYGGANLAKKIGYFVNSQEEVIKNITAKLDSDIELPNFKIGT